MIEFCFRGLHPSRMRKMWHIIFALPALFTGGELRSSETFSDADALAMVERSLPFIRENGIAWMEERECTSCHQVPAMLWSLNRAESLGLDAGAGAAEIAEWSSWAADWRHWNKTGDKEGIDKVSAGNIDTMVFLLL